MITVLCGLNTLLRVLVPWLAQLMLKLKRKFTRTAVNSPQIAPSRTEAASVPGKTMTLQYTLLPYSSFSSGTQSEIVVSLGVAKSQVFEFIRVTFG